MKTITYYLGYLFASLMFVNPRIGQITTDSYIDAVTGDTVKAKNAEKFDPVNRFHPMAPGSAKWKKNEDPASQALRSLRRANTVNYISIGLGLASNIEMAIIGGFPLEVDEGLNPGVNVSHMILGIGRLSISLFPIISIANARKVLKPWRVSPEIAPTCKKLFSYMDVAQVLTAAAPVLCVAGGIMMIAASTSRTEYVYPDYHTSIKNPALKTAGWICLGAGLAASITSAICIDLAKKELRGKMGSMKVSAGPAGVGVIYHLPGQPNLQKTNRTN
ncbi:MAG: hypothetical protein V1733_03350 [bacterium]